MSLSAPERQRNILEHVIVVGRISINEICEQFSVSIATARRDLESLAEQSKLERVHGGAVRIAHAPDEPPISHRQRQQSIEKQRIAAATAELIDDGETIFLGAGSTIEAVAKAILQKQKLTVITNSLLVINALAGQPGLEMICLGGMFRSSEMCFLGHITEQALSYVRADKAILGTYAIDIQHGLTNDHLPQTSTDRASIAIGKDVIIAADHTKIARISTGFVAPVDKIHTFVTNEQTPLSFVDELKGKGVNVTLV